MKTKVQTRPQKLLQATVSMFLILCILVGCNGEILDSAPSESPIISGDLSYYASMEESSRSAICNDTLIEITGEVSFVGYHLLYLGDILTNDILVICTFSNSDDTLDNITNGDVVTIQGACSLISGQSFYLDDCQLVSCVESTDINTDTLTYHTEFVQVTGEETTESTTTEATDITVTENNQITTETTTIVETVHTHNFSAATCTSPKACSCGATQGTSNGHTWTSATCTEPKKCTVCGVTSGLTAGHNFSDGKCTVCGKQDPDYTHETMVWIPTNGGTKYHTHAGCSNMENPEQVTQSEAEELGYTPCKRCH